MTDTLFSALELDPKLEQAVTTMGFQIATPVQAQSIPLIRTGVDVIARSQTGTGKTVAFAIPAMECICADNEKPTIQVLILCPTRELAQQAGEEIRKLAKFMPYIRPVEIYGGTNMERQFIRLRRANIVVGTPGRVIDHMRRKTLKLDHLKMVVLDEADEMLKMGFKEDIETILEGTPSTRQTILFSATMPPAIMALASQFQKKPEMIEIDKERVTIQNIEQKFIDAPAGGKVATLIRLLRYHRPNRALVFCNTKRMVDELTVQLNQNGFTAESIHGDLGQTQRSSVMNSFKQGKTSILIATDVAARGIDVNDLDYVFNFDIPLKTEHYVHRIGRTGRAGKSGCAISICSGKRQIRAMYGIACEIKSKILQMAVPTIAEIQSRELDDNLKTVEMHLLEEADSRSTEMVRALVERGHSLEHIASVALKLQFCTDNLLQDNLQETTLRLKTAEFCIPTQTRHITKATPAFASICFDVGSSNRVSPKHFVGAITELSGLSGKEIGNIQIYQDHSVVSIPEGSVSAVLESMRSCKICGKPAHVTLHSDSHSKREGYDRHVKSKPAHNVSKYLSAYPRASSRDPVRRKAERAKQAI